MTSGCFAARPSSAGGGVAEVVAVGAATRLGAVARLAQEARPPKTPLQRALRALARPLLLAALGFAVVIPALQVLLRQARWQEAVLSGLSLAFATIPEELPILVTLVLGLGALRLARSHALVRGLRPAETLGHVTAVLSDKTGTLTENRLRLERVVARGADGVDGRSGRAELVRAAYHSLGLERGGFGSDPVERAVAAALESELMAGGLTAGLALERRVPFSRERGWSGAVWRDGSRRILYVKGAPETVVRRVAGLGEGDRWRILDQVARLAGEGQRVLAVASAEVLADGAPGPWSYLGLLALADPLRAEAGEAVREVQGAGVRVLLATGDHPGIAAAIARQVGVRDERVVTGGDLSGMSEEQVLDALAAGALFARISPADKLRLVRGLQAQGEIVAMTGDGINDAPALKAADVGIAMGLHGTDAAREAGSVILTDDRFATLAGALREGRVLRANLRKAVRYYLAVKVGLVLTMQVPILAGFGPPLAPAMIVLLELFMDLAASTAFVIEPPERDLMREPPPRPDRRVLDGSMARGILVGGALLAAAVLASAYLGRLVGGAPAYQSAAFAGWMLAHVALAFGYRTWTAPSRARGAFSNRVLNLWALAAVGTALVATYLPWAHATLGTVALPAAAWGLMLVAVGSLVVVGARLGRSPA